MRGHPVVYDRAYAPYGEQYDGSSNSDLDFTGQSQDTLSGMYDFLYREYNPVQGRWISPDPTGPDAADAGNPQTWNLYAYVLNNPLANKDPDGLDCIHINSDTGLFESFDHGDCDNSPEEKANSGQYVDGTVSTIYTTTGGVVTGYSGMRDNGTVVGGAFATPLDTPPTDAIYGIFGMGQAAVLQMHDSFAKFPNICSLTFSLNVGGHRREDARWG
jgi:RHS repeat-associated protein